MIGRASAFAGAVALVCAGLPAASEWGLLVRPSDGVTGVTPVAAPRAATLTPSRAAVAAAVDRHAARHGVPADLFHRLVKRESGYNPAALGPATPWGRAQGPTQILCSTARGLGEADCGRLRRDPARAVELAALYLRQGFAATGSWRGAAAYYHGGPNRALHGRKTAAYAAAVAGAFAPQRIAWNVAALAGPAAHHLKVPG